VVPLRTRSTRSAAVSENGETLPHSAERNGGKPPGIGKPFWSTK
jgi:hypothetical protein